MKALIVEDDEISLKIIERILFKHDIEYISQQNGLSALDFFKSGGMVDIIISDLMMPEMDGFRMIETIRQDKRLSQIPIILCTALSDQESVIEGIKLGVKDYITKPVSEDRLMEKINKVVNSLESVLIVEDEITICRLLEKILENGGYNTISVQSIKEAQNIIDKRNIRLVISNAKMPKMEGLELLRETKQKKPDLPFLMITEFDRKYDKKDVIALGAAGIIKRPFHNIDILSQIKRIIG